MTKIGERYSLTRAFDVNSEYEMSLVAYKDNLYTIIDSSFGGQTYKVFQYHIPTDTWSEYADATPISFSIIRIEAIVVESSIYYFNNNIFFYRFDIESKTWTELTFPLAVSGSGFGNLQYDGVDTIYYGMNYGVSGTEDLIYQYSISGDSWSTLETPFPSLNIGIVADLKGSLYVLTFNAPFATVDSPTHLYKYNIISGEWIQLNDPPSRINLGFSNIVYSGFEKSFYVQSYPRYTTEETFFKYDISKGIWTTIPFTIDGVFGASLAGLAASENFLYSFGWVPSTGLAFFSSYCFKLARSLFINSNVGELQSGAMRVGFQGYSKSDVVKRSIVRRSVVTDNFTASNVIYFGACVQKGQSDDTVITHNNEEGYVGVALEDIALYSSYFKSEDNLNVMRVGMGRIMIPWDRTFPRGIHLKPIGDGLFYPDDEVDGTKTLDCQALTSEKITMTSYAYRLVDSNIYP